MVSVWVQPDSDVRSTLAAFGLVRDSTRHLAELERCVCDQILGAKVARLYVRAVPDSKNDLALALIQVFPQQAKEWPADFDPQPK